MGARDPYGTSGPIEPPTYQELWDMIHSHRDCMAQLQREKNELYSEISRLEKRNRELEMSWNALKNNAIAGY